MISKSSYGSLSGAFRLTSREYGAVNYMRRRMNMNLTHIASALGRSVASIHRVIRVGAPCPVDNRGQTKTAYGNRRYAFDMNKRSLRLRVRMYFLGIVDTLQEALDAQSIPLPLLKKLSESTGDSEEEDPA